MHIDIFYIEFFFILLFFTLVLIFIYWSHDKVSLDDINEAIYKADQKTDFIEKISKVDEVLATELRGAAHQGKISLFKAEKRYTPIDREKIEKNKSID
ncbi:MAG: hypothetical protein WCP91_01860 [Candidatus Berkelbacteria bacterium]